MESNDKAMTITFCTMMICVAFVLSSLIYRDALETERAIKAGLQQSKAGSDVIWVYTGCKKEVKPSGMISDKNSAGEDHAD